MTDRLREAATALLREAKAVADDHHSPRYARLDDAIESLRARLAEPEPEPVANGWKLREVLFEDGEPIAHREPPTRRPLTPVQEAAPELLEALRGMLAIVNDSRGVAGYHLNGNTAEWDEFDEVDFARAIERAHKIGGNDE